MHINKRNSAFWETARSVGIISKNNERRSKIENEASPENQLVDWWKAEPRLKELKRGSNCSLPKK